MSADGRYVAFHSNASNLVLGDNNGAYDVFVHDRNTGQTTRVSVASNGSEANNNSCGGSSTWATISDDGSYVGFQSDADNLVPNDGNGVDDIFVHDRTTGKTTRISVASDGTQGNNASAYADISANGRYIAFKSNANNLVQGDTNQVQDVFVRDLETGKTTRVNVASDGSQANNSYDVFTNPAISADGRYVAFDSNANNLVPGDTNQFTNFEGEIEDALDVFLHDRQTGKTTRVSVASDGSQGNNSSYVPAITGDGRYVVFYSEASNLVSADTNQWQDVFVHDRGF